jgi:hypothetical protein
LFNDIQKNKNKSVVGYREIDTMVEIDKSLRKIDWSLMFEFIKWDYMYNNTLMLEQRNYLNVYLSNGQIKEFLDGYFTTILNEKALLLEGPIDLIKGLIRFIYNSTKTVVNILRKLGNNKAVEKIKQDKELIFGVKASKFILKMGVSRLIWQGLTKVLNPYTTAVTAALVSLGAPGLVASIISTLLVSTIYSKSLNLIKKVISIVNGAIKKWAFGNNDKDKIKEESLKLAKMAINMEASQIKKIEDPKKKEMLEERLKKQQERLKNELRKAKEQKREHR